MAYTLFHDVGVETLYTDYSIGYTVRPMHIYVVPVLSVPWFDTQ